MEIEVRYFAMLREKRGCSSERLSVRDGLTAGELYDELFPPGPEGQVPVAYAVNGTYAHRTTGLAEGDEVAFLPPVGGGV